MVIQKKSSELTQDDINIMYNILINNLASYIPNFEEKEDDKERWVNSILKNDFNFILVYDNDVLIAFLEYCYADDCVYISEIDIDDNHKGDNNTFYELMNAFYQSIDDSYTIRGHINDSNSKSIGVFTHLGMKKIDNKKYEMTYSDLEKYINNKKTRAI